MGVMKTSVFIIIHHRHCAAGQCKKCRGMAETFLMRKHELHITSQGNAWEQSNAEVSGAAEKGSPFVHMFSDDC